MAIVREGKLVGRLLGGRLRLLRLLGVGGYGEVYLARHAKLGTPMAVKVMRPDVVGERGVFARFEREARAAARIDHPHLVRVVDFDTEPEVWIAMEYVEGPTLADLVGKRGALTPERTVRLLAQVLGALAALHDAGIIHRDVKAENVIVQKIRDDDGGEAERAKLCDLGVAKLLRAGAEEDTAITATGVLVGTPEYIAPERSRGSDADPRSDLYSLGVVLYLVLTGRLPFESRQRAAVLRRHLAEEIAAPSTLRANVHPGLERVCMRALEKEPERRFVDAREMRAALLAALEAGSPAGDAAPLPSPTPTKRPRASPRRALPGLFGVVLAGAAVGAAFVAWDLQRGGGAAAPSATISVEPPASAAFSADETDSPTAKDEAPPPSRPAEPMTSAATAIRARAATRAPEGASSSATPRVESPGEPPAPPDPSLARVIATPKQVYGAAPGQLLNALGPRAFSTCYRESLKTSARPVGPTSTTLRVESDESGEIIKARVSPASGLPAFGPCVEQLVLRRIIPGVEGRTVIADVRLDLEPR